MAVSPSPLIAAIPYRIARRSVRGTSNARSELCTSGGRMVSPARRQSLMYTRILSESPASMVISAAMYSARWWALSQAVWYAT